MSDESERRKKAEHERLHKQRFNPFAFGFDPSIYGWSEIGLKYIKHQCDQANLLFRGGAYLTTYADYSKVTKQDMFAARELIDDAQRAMDDPANHPQIPQVKEWAPEHKRAAYELLKETRDRYRSAAAEVETAHQYPIKDLLKEAWHIFEKVKFDAPSPYRPKPRDVFAKLKEAQALISASYLQKANRDDLRSKVDAMWKQVQEYIGEQQQQWEERQRARAARDAERAQKNREWRERQEGHVARWKSRISNQYEFIARLRAQIDDLQGKKYAARTSEHADRVQGWIDEKLEKIGQVQEDINELENRISDVRRRLEEDRH